MGKTKASKWYEKSPEVRAIYWAYPRHIGKREALKAIGEAITRITQEKARMVFDDPAPGEVDVSIDDPFDWLLKRTELFASSIAGKKGVFTPHPATWFNQDRFDDDPAEWNRTEEGSRPEPERWEVEF